MGHNLRRAQFIRKSRKSFSYGPCLRHRAVRIIVVLWPQSFAAAFFADPFRSSRVMPTICYLQPLEPPRRTIEMAAGFVSAAGGLRRF